MPHSPRHDEDFIHYPQHREKALRQIREIQMYLAQLEVAVRAFPADRDSAGYMDLDNIEQLNADLDEAINSVCDWDSLDMEFFRLSLPTEVAHG